MMTNKLSLVALVVGPLCIFLGFFDRVHGDSLVVAGAILISAGIIATSIIEGRRPS
jgi:hypothetical protein